MVRPMNQLTISADPKELEAFAEQSLRELPKNRESRDKLLQALAEKYARLGELAEKLAQDQTEAGILLAARWISRSPASESTTRRELCWLRRTQIGMTIHTAARLIGQRAQVSRSTDRFMRNCGRASSFLPTCPVPTDQHPRRQSMDFLARIWPPYQLAAPPPRDPCPFQPRLRIDLPSHVDRWRPDKCGGSQHLLDLCRNDLAGK
jgi:hypothetical protein